MYISLPPKKCSQCGSIDCESFHRENRNERKSGMRCLNCGHESIESDRKSSGDQVKWIHTAIGNTF